MTAAPAVAARRESARRSLVVLWAVFASAALLAGGLGGALPAAAAEPPASVQPEPGDQVNPADPSALSSDQQRLENVIAAARQYLGVPYRVGSEGPSLFDCSGLVFRAFSDAGLPDRIGGARLRAAGYLRWFAGKGQMTPDESQAQRGELVIYNGGSHIGIYLGDGRVISALLSGVTVHSLHGVSLPVTGFLRPDWSGKGEVVPFVPVDLPEVPEAPATLVESSSWMPALDAAALGEIDRKARERVDLRTPSTRTFQNRDGTFTTEFHAQPIFYLPPDSTELQPIDLHFSSVEDAGAPQAMVSASPVVLTARSADDQVGFLSAAAGTRTVSLGLADRSGKASTAGSDAAPEVLGDGAYVDYFDFQSKGVGLRVLARPDGFKSFLVLSRDPDRNRFAFTLDAPGLTASVQEDGSVALIDQWGASLGTIPSPLLLDSSDVDGNGGGVYTSAARWLVSTAGGATTLTLSVDRRNLDEAVYPAYVDISLVDFGGAQSPADLSFASSDQPNASMAGYERPESGGYGELWLGRQPNSRNDNEIFVRWNELASTLGTVDVASAALELVPYLQRADDGPTVVSQIAADWSTASVTWNARPETDAELAVGTTEQGQRSSFDVSSYVTDVLSHGVADHGLMLSGDGSGSSSWKRLVADDVESADMGPLLVVTWSGLRPNPVATDTESATNFEWALPALAGSQTRFQVEVSNDGFATVLAGSDTVKGKLGKIAAWTLPSGALSNSGSYEWRVRVKFADESAWSEWSSPQSFSWGSPRAENLPAAPDLLERGL